jgi:multicomponent Na+:H+ antiporter subunit D
MLISASLQEGPLGVALVVIIVVSSLMSVLYIWRVVELAYFGDPPESACSAGEAPAWMLVGTWGAALLNIYFGVVPALPLSLAGEAAASLLQHLP